MGHRLSEDWHDTIHIGGFSRDCAAWRTRRSSLLVPGNVLVECRVEGSALTVLNEVLSWDMGTMHITQHDTRHGRP